MTYNPISILVPLLCRIPLEYPHLLIPHIIWVLLILIFIIIGPFRVPKVLNNLFILLHSAEHWISSELALQFLIYLIDKLMILLFLLMHVRVREAQAHHHRVAQLLVEFRGQGGPDRETCEKD